MKLSKALEILDDISDKINEIYCDMYEDEEITREFLEGALDGVMAFNENMTSLLQSLSEINFL